MKLKVKEQIKTLLAQEGIRQKELAELLASKKGRSYSPANLSKKLNRQTFTYNEVLEIAEILGYRIEFIKEG